MPQDSTGFWIGMLITALGLFAVAFFFYLQDDGSSVVLNLVGGVALSVLATFRLRRR
jgi:hypothetical protein